MSKPAFPSLSWSVARGGYPTPWNLLRQASAKIILGATLGFAVGGILCHASQSNQSKLGKNELEMLQDVLKTVREDITKSYYDPHFHGLDLEARFQEALVKISAAPSLNYAIADIAGAVSALNDSHTIFIPPPRTYVHDYGWRMEAIGDSDCFITAVRPGSDAEKKGVKAGDQLLSVAGYPAIREDVWKINYVFRTLRPQPGLRLVLRSPDGNVRQLDTAAELQMLSSKSIWQTLDEYENRAKKHRPGFLEYGKEGIIFKLPDFEFDPDKANEMLDKVRSHDALLIDLRGNPGGYEEFLSRLLGGMFDHEVKIGDRVGRKLLRSSVTKSRGKKTFAGKLIVLIDSGSASAAELFARVVQLEKRGTVIGDRSSGKVMESRFHPHQLETIKGMFNFGIFIAEADLVMADGRSLENNGVVPDERMIPTAADLAGGRDPVLAHAAGLIGVALTPEEAGRLFPIEWETH